MIKYKRLINDKDEGWFSLGVLIIFIFKKSKNVRRKSIEYLIEVE